MQLQTQTIEQICRKFKMEAEKISDVIDSSKGEADIRLMYIINDNWVLRLYNTKKIIEEYLVEYHELVQKYRALGVERPDLRKTVEDTYLCNAFCNMQWLYCYMEEL